MSFALRSATRAIPRVTSTRAFSSTVVYQKSATETVKQGLDNLNKTVGSKLAEGIDAAGTYQPPALLHPTTTILHVAKWLTRCSAENAGQKVKDAATGNQSAAGKAEELKGKAKGLAEEAKGKAKGAAEDVKKNL